MNDRKNLGNVGERFVVTYLQQQRFTIHAQNYRKFFGEIDIIASKKNLYIFVEVKTRASDIISMGQLISPSKQVKIIKTAQNFIAEHKLGDTIVFRFDVALLLKNDISFSMNYIENAFTQQKDNYDYC